MKFSDLNKDKKTPEKAPSPELPAAAFPAPPPSPWGAPPRPQIPGNSSPPPPPRKPPIPLEAAKAVAAVSLALQRQTAQQTYGQAIGAMKTFLREDASIPAAYRPIDDAARALVSLILENNSALLAMTVRSTASNYLYAHSVNTAVLAAFIARGMGWDVNRLQTLAVCSLLSDIGMLKHLGLAREARALTSEERQEIRLHPVESRRMLDLIHDIEASVRKTIAEVIEAEMAVKTPAKARDNLEKGSDLHMAAEIIALCDIYEAMSHPRSWRKPLLPHEAVKTLIIKHGEDFSRPIIKMFVEKLSIYPPGSWVELNSGELAVVVAANPKLPTIPTVEIRVRADGSPLEPTQTVDLSQISMTHVAKAVDETEIVLRDKKLMLQLQAARWWVE